MIIKHSNVRMEAKSTANAGDKSVRYLEKDGVVYALELTCSCGDTTVVELEYQARPPQPQAPANEPDPAE